MPPMSQTSVPTASTSMLRMASRINTGHTKRQPGAVAHPGDRQPAHHHRRGGGDQVDQAVGGLVGGDHQIARHPGELGERRHDRHGDRRQPRTGGDQEGERQIEQVGDEDEARRCSSPATACSAQIQHGVGDQAVVHDHGDAARHADDQRHAQHVARAVDEGIDQFLLRQPADDADQDAEEQEAGGHLREPPPPGGDRQPEVFPGDHAVDHHHEGQDEQHQDHLVPAGERPEVGPFAAAGQELLLVLGLLVVDRATWSGSFFTFSA